MTAHPAAALDERERALLLDILRAHSVRHAAIFGSFARGEQHTGSDLDLLIDLPTGKSLFDLSVLGIALEDALGRSVDIVTSVESLHPLIRERVLREQEVLL